MLDWPGRLAVIRESAVQPGAREAPVALDGAQRGVDRTGGLRARHSGKKTQHDDAMLPGVLGLESLQRIIECEQIIARGIDGDGEVVEVDAPSAAAALQRSLGPRPVHEDLSHGPAGGEEEMSAVCPAVL